MTRRIVALLLMGLGLAAPGGAGKTLPAPLAGKVNKAVDLGLRYLRDQQVDGKWGMSIPTGKDGSMKFVPHPGITALAIVPFLESHRRYDDKDGPFIRKPILYLLANQKPDGGIYDRQLANYVTSVSILALTSARKNFKDEELRARIAAAIEKAKAFLVKLQADEGEGYTPKDKFYGGVGYGGDLRPDVSNTQLAVEALNQAGLPRDHPFFKKAIAFLQRCQNRSESNDQKWAGNDGGFVYYPGKTYAGTKKLPSGKVTLRSYGSMTYAGLKSFIHAYLTRDDPRVQAAFAWITRHYTLRENPNLGQQGLYYYYHTFAKAFRAYGVDVITDAKGRRHDWRQDLARELVARQATGEKDFGSWVNQQPRWWEGNRVLATTYALLALVELTR